MSEDSVYNDADIVWVKLGNSWWPGEVCGQQRQPEGFLQLAKRKPYCVVKFFQEETFEYVKSSKHILPFNCSKKDEFIKRGHELFKAKKKFMEKFPSDVSTAERLTRSVTRSTLFFNSRPDSIVKAILGQSPAKIDMMRNNGRCDSVTKIMNLTPNRNTETRSASSSPATYKCSLCDFQSCRQNVMVLHRKSHSNAVVTTRCSLTSTNISPNEVNYLNRSASQTIPLGTLPSPTRSTVFKATVATPVQANESDINAGDEPCSSEKHFSLKIKSTKCSTVARKNDIPDIQNQTNITTLCHPLNGKEVTSFLLNKSATCKSVEIQKSLLADWMDEEKDDEDEEQNVSEIKSAATNEHLPEPNEKEINSGLTISAPTSPELLKGVDLNYHETSSSSESSKPSTKIRNIPKKDRRNINFIDFREDQKIDLRNKTAGESELSTYDQLSSVDQAHYLPNATFSSKQDDPQIVSVAGDGTNLGKENQFAKKNLSDSKATVDSNVIEDMCIQNDAVVPQDGTCENQIKNKSMSKNCGLNTTTSTMGIECSTEFPTSKVNVDCEPMSEPIISDLTNNAVQHSSSKSPEISNNLKNSIYTTTEISIGSKAILFTNSPTQEKLNMNPDNNYTLLEKENILEQVYSGLPNERLNNKNAGGVDMPLEENIKNQDCEYTLCGNESTGNEITLLETEKGIPKTIDNPIEQTQTSPLGKVSNEQQKLLQENPIAKQDTGKNFIEPESYNSSVSGASSVIIDNEIHSREATTNYNKNSPQCYDKSITLPLNVNEVHEIYDDCACVLPANSRPPNDPTLLLQTILKSKENQELQAGETITPDALGEFIANANVEEDSKNKYTVLKEVAEPVQKIALNPTEVSDSQISKSNNKTSLSCFDFEEEEDNDILTSIAKFKQNNISSERNSDINKECLCKTADVQNIERELKDKQLSAEIESLLRTTEMLVPANTSASAEVRGLPIKERGKRIFKSRNRFKTESCSSVLVTAVATKNTESFTPVKEEENGASCPAMKVHLHENEGKIDQENRATSEQAKINESTGNELDKVSFDEDNAINNKVLNYEEEIVGRVVFSPAEVYAPSPQSNIVLENTDTQVNSSGIEIVNVPLPASAGRSKEDSLEETQFNKDLQNNTFENLKANEHVGFQSENPVYYDVIHETPLEAISQFVEPQDTVKNRIVAEVMNDMQRDIHEEVAENQILHEDMNVIAQELHEQVEHEGNDDIQQEVHDQLNEFFVVEESETIYEEEVSYEDVSNKAIDSAYENSNDYELITTEVSSIVERIGNEENSTECRNVSIENVPNVSYMLEDLTKIENNKPTSEQPLFSTKNNETADSKTTLVREVSLFPEVDQLAQSDNAILSDESNTCSTLENTSKSSYNDKNIHQEQKSTVTQADRTETSSDENSTIISEAEAEFGSPTSMLEEDRVLKRSRRGSETSATNIDCPKSYHTSQVQKTDTIMTVNRLCRADNIALHSDINESESNDVQSSSSNIEDNEKGSKKENVNNIIMKVIQSELLKMKEKEESTFIQVSSKNEQNLSMSNSDTDLCYEEDEEDEEEISSPPIEPIQDESAVETYPEINFRTSSSAEFSYKKNEKCGIHEDDVQKSIDDVYQQEKSPSVLNSLTQCNESVIKLNMNKDSLAEVEAISSQAIGQTSDIAGEELSAAEALLSIPNQPNNVGHSTDLSTRTTVPFQSSTEENKGFAVTAIDVKDEPMDNSDIPSNLSVNTSKGVIRRKGRSHLKVTPRKRIIDTNYSGTHPVQELGTKIPKFSHDLAPTSSKSKATDESHENKTAEQKVDGEGVCKIDPVLLEKSTPEKVHITVDISNPLSSQIANILGSMDSSESTVKNVTLKRKTTLEDDITSFVIKKPIPTTDAEAEAADRETIAQIQNLCPQVEITRKSSKDEQSSLTTNLSQSTMPLILNNQILRPGNNQPIITVTPKSNKIEDTFDINNMPIVLSNDNVMNEKVHLVITPTSNPQIIKQFQSQQHLVYNQRPDNRSFTPSPINVVSSRITCRRQSNLRTKRTPTRQQIHEQNCQKEQDQQKSNQISQDENSQSDIFKQISTPHSQINIHQPQTQQQQTAQLQQHKRQQQFRASQQIQMHNQHSPAQFQNQFQLHQQQKLHQQLHEEQSILMQQKQQLMIQQQNQQRPQLQRTQQQQQQMLIHQQLLPVEKSKPLNTSEKQMGVDARGKKYVIIKAPSNTVVLDNSPDTIKGGIQNVQQPPHIQQEKNSAAQRKQRQTINANKRQLSQQSIQSTSMQTIQSTSMQSMPSIKPPNQASTVTQLTPSPLPQISPVSSHTIHNSPNVSYTSETQRYVNDQQTTQFFTPSLAPLHMTPAKGRKSARGRRAKQIATGAPSLQTVVNTPKNTKSNANGKRTTGSYCESPRPRITRSSAAKKNNLASSLPSELIPTTAYHSMCSVNTVNTVTTISTPIEHSLPIKGQTEPDKQEVTADIPIEKSRVSGGCYAVPALPVPGFPHTFLVCELIDNKYREAYSKLLYLSPDGTRLCEIPDELVTEAHLKLREDQREPNPDYIQVGSGALQIDKSIRLQMLEQDKVQADGGMENNQKPKEIFKHDSLSVEDEASALLCLQEQIAQEQLAQEHLVQKQYIPEHLVHEQLVQEQLAQEQLVQEQLVQEQQFVQEHFVQDQFGREQFVQEQFVQEQFVSEQFVQEQIAQEQLVRGQFIQHEMKGNQDILHVTHSIENDETHDNIIQQLDADTVVMGESVESPNAVVLNIGSQHLVLDHTAFMNMCENNTESMSPDGNIFTLTQEGLQELLNSCNSTRNEASAMVFTGEGCEQRVMMNENILHTGDTSPDCLRIALNDPRLYTDEQFINSGSILQIETPEGLRLISTAPGSSGIVIQSMPSEAKTGDGNILEESHKSSPANDDNDSDNTKSKFESEPSANNFDDCLNVLGVSSKSPSVPTSLELSQSETVTKNRGPSPGTIAMNEIVATGLCHHPDITSLPSMGSNEQDMHYGFFSTNTGSHDDKVTVNGESIVTDMDEYTVGSSSGNFDDPGR